MHDPSSIRSASMRDGISCGSLGRRGLTALPAGGVSASAALPSTECGDSRSGAPRSTDLSERRASSQTVRQPQLSTPTRARTAMGCAVVLALLVVPSAGRAELLPQPVAVAEPLGAAPAPSVAPQPVAEPARGSPFTVRLAADLPLTLGAGVLALTTELVKSELPGPTCGTACDPAGINSLDSLGLGSHSREARTASDLLVGVNVGLPLVADLLDVLVSRPPDGWRGYGADFLVLAEVMAVNAGLNGLVKSAVRRPRPRQPPQASNGDRAQKEGPKKPEERRRRHGTPESLQSQDPVASPKAPKPTIPCNPRAGVGMGR